MNGPLWRDSNTYVGSNVKLSRGYRMQQSSESADRYWENRRRAGSADVKEFVESFERESNEMTLKEEAQCGLGSGYY